MPFELEQIGLELGSWPVPTSAVAVDDERRQHLGVAVLAGVQVEHEGDQRALESRAGAEGDGEARAGELGAALEVEDAQRRPEVPVRLGLEVEPRGSPTTRSTRFALSSAPRDRGSRRAGWGGAHSSSASGRVELAESRLLRLDGALEAADLGDLGRGVAPLLLEPPISRLASLRCRFSSSTSTRPPRRSASRASQRSRGSPAMPRAARPARTRSGSPRRRSRESMTAAVYPRLREGVNATSLGRASARPRRLC